MREAFLSFVLALSINPVVWACILLAFLRTEKAASRTREGHRLGSRMGLYGIAV